MRSAASQEGLTARAKVKGRKTYQIVQSFNVVSFTLLSGSVLTLYALKLGADSFFIGLISSLVNLSLLFMIAGRGLVSRLGPRRQYGLGWILRNLTMVPILLAPLFIGNRAAALILIFFPFLCFNIFKGIGLVGFNPILGSLSEGKDRGSYLSKLQINIHAILIVTNLCIAFFLGVDAKISRYVVLIGAGIGFGIVAAIFIFRLPEPAAESRSTQPKFSAGIRDGLRRRDFRTFIVLASIIAFIAGMANPFLLVYSKKVYKLSDSFAILFLVVGNIGAIAMGILVRKLIDRLGAKPLYIVFLGVLCLSIIPILISPSLESVPKYIFLGALFFFYNFGFIGGVNSAQNYFFAITNATEHLNLGLLYNVVGGAAGTVGSLAGGALLNGFDSLFDSEIHSFRALYGLVFVLLIFSFPLLLRLKNVGRFSVRSALEVLLSRKDMKAVALLHKLDTTRTVGEELKVIESLAVSDSAVPVTDLLEKLKSPRFYVRSRALRALEMLPLSEKVGEALITEVKSHGFTTAHVAARIMGRKAIRQGIGELRKALGSSDYLLQAEAMLALARLGDRSSIENIEAALAEGAPALVQIYAAAALEILQSVPSIPALLGALKQSVSPPYLRDELILSLSGILGIEDWFYEYYSQFLEMARKGLNALSDYMEDFDLDVGKRKLIGRMLELLLSDRGAFGDVIAEAYTAVDTGDAPYMEYFQVAFKDADLLRLDRFAFFLCAVLIRLECRD